MPTQRASARVRLAITVDIEPCERGIMLVVKPANEAEELVSERSSVVLSLSREGPSVVRGTITHASGAVAHFQGTEGLIQMAQTLNLRLKPAD